MLPNDFAILILSHKRPENPTYKTLMKCNYSHKLYFILDDEDPSIPQYEAKYGKDKLLIFNKKEMAKNIDLMDNWEMWSIDTYARNASFQLAKSVGINYFLLLDDDYDSFRYRFFSEHSVVVKQMNRVCEVYLDYFKKHTQIKALCFAQGADVAVIVKGQTKRKAMNALFLSIDRPVHWIGHMNADVNAYTRYGQLGHIMITFPHVQLNQEPTQTKGGSAGMYREIGTYQKSFYSVMQCPSFVKVSTFTKGFRMSKFRFHHKIDFKKGCARIISSRYKKQ